MRHHTFIVAVTIIALAEVTLGADCAASGAPVSGAGDTKPPSTGRLTEPIVRADEAGLERAGHGVMATTGKSRSLMTMIMCWKDTAETTVIPLPATR